MLEQEAAANGAEMSRDAKGKPVFALPGILPVSAMAPDMIDLGIMVKAMDDRRIDAYALSLTRELILGKNAARLLKL